MGACYLPNLRFSAAKSRLGDDSCSSARFHRDTDDTFLLEAVKTHDDS